MTKLSPFTHPGRKAPEPMLRSLSMRLRSAKICHVCLVAVLLLLAPGAIHAKSDQASSQLAFGVDMAKRGLWKEALFRFQQAEKLEPENPRIQSNLGVAAEAAGQFDKALEYSKKPLRLAPNERGTPTTSTRFVDFYQGFRGKKEPKKGTLTMPAPSAPAQKAPPA